MIGLVLEGGAMRGLFTAGVTDYLMEKGITFDGAVGVSAGATFGVNYKSHQIGRALRYNKRYCADPRYGSFRSFLKTGDVFDRQFCYYDIPERLDPFDTDTIQANPMEFYVVASDVETGKSYYHKLTDGKGRDIEYIRASASIPLLSRIVRIEGHQLLDGGICDSIPLRFMETQGYLRNVVILTQPFGYVKKPNSYMPLVHLRYHAHPQFVQAMANRHEMYNAETAYVAQREKEGDAFVIRPDAALNISAMTKDPQEMQRVYDIGRRIAQEKFEALQMFMTEAKTQA